MACNGNCNQGRLCDCVPDIEEDELFGVFEGMFTVIALWGVIAVIGAIAGVIWSMP